MIATNWPQELKIFRLRAAITLALIAIQITGVYHIAWWAFWTLFIVGGILLIINWLGFQKRWVLLPTINLLADQVITIFILANTRGALSPLIFLCYLHLISAIVFFGQTRIVVPVGGVQTFNVAISTLLAMRFGSGSSLAVALIHAIGFMLIALFLAEPASTLHHEAQRDPLTGSLNRRSGLKALAAWCQEGQAFSLLFADLKKFKTINDHYGHTVGDEVLAAIAHSLNQSTREDDLVIRYGGDEFLTATRGKTEPVIERIRSLLSQPIQTSAGAIEVAIDVGIARYPDEAKTVEALIARADHEMFKAKAGS